MSQPVTRDFMAGLDAEVQHQLERWGRGHDDGKTPDDWLWLIAFLATKATQAFRYGDIEKGLHHIITTAAVCKQWHERMAQEYPAAAQPPRGAP